MIKSRVYYIVWLLASLLLYLWSDSWIACFLVAVSVILPLVSGLWLLTEKRQIHCYFQIKDIAGKGQEAKGSLCVENHGFLPLETGRVLFGLSEEDPAAGVGAVQ